MKKSMENTPDIRETEQKGARDVSFVIQKRLASLDEACDEFTDKGKLIKRLRENYDTLWKRSDSQNRIHCMNNSVAYQIFGRDFDGIITFWTRFTHPWIISMGKDDNPCHAYKLPKVSTEDNKKFLERTLNREEYEKWISDNYLADKKKIIIELRIQCMD